LLQFPVRFPCQPFVGLNGQLRKTWLTRALEACRSPAERKRKRPKAEVNEDEESRNRRERATEGEATYLHLSRQFVWLLVGQSVLPI